MQVLEVAVIGVQDPTYGEVIAAVIVPRARVDSALSTDDIRLFLKDRLAPYKHPRIVRLVEHIPRNQLGKVLYARNYELLRHCCLWLFP